MPAPAFDAPHEVEQLVALGPRAPGSDAERRAAVHLRKRLEALGREARIEPTSVFPSYATAHLVHAVLAVAGSVLAVDVPIAGTALLALVAVSTLGDLTGRLHLARRLTGRRASQNVVSEEGGEKPGVVVLLAHYDTARTGLVFGPRIAERRAVLGRLLRRQIGLFEPLAWSILLVLACAAVRVAGVDALALTVVQFVPTVVLIVAVPLLADVALSDAVPGANDDASGVATALRLAERHGGRLEHFDVWVLLTGANEGLMLGMAAWLRAHRRELDPRATVFVDLVAVGRGMPRYATKEGLVLASPYHPELVALCGELAEEHGARRVALRSHSDAHMARLRGYPAIRISCFGALDYAPHEHLPSDVPRHVDPAALDRAFAFCSDLLELLDERIGPDLEYDEAGADEGPEDR